ncbi:DUF927 domain-containing protein [Xanthomonas arboricola]|uniref:DUF927 domain-containing protein n=1 Tax=Xanthomonas arboricola TaxID=56448 RepID=UPI000CEE9937|nr:DUF927 domain-containing protein [Xanthomonas arboricola]PPU10256.1 hypothetical protein XarjCFBP1022_16015 [Xanthomonas arboricola]
MSNTIKSVDFNDAAKAVGKKAVRSSIEAAVRKGSGTSKARTDTAAGAKPHYRLSDAGVFYVGVNEDGEQAEPQFICSPLKVEAKTRNSQSEEWGRLLSWTDADGHRHQWAAPAEMLVGDPREFVRQLAAGGVEMSAHRSTMQRLLAYIIQERIDARARNVAVPGWHDSSYVLPSGESYGAGEELLVYQHSGGLQHHYAAVGTLDDWKREVAARCAGNSRLVLAVATMFAGPLLRFTGATGGGFHIVGGSSSGKTTALRVAASVVGPPEYAREWRSTANGLEGVAVLHNDATLILDELAQIDPKQAGDAAYLLANGNGKSRANRAGDARAAARWRIMILSAGEVGLAQHMAEAGKQARAGQAVRLADVPAEAEAGHGVFERLHDASDGAALSALLKDASARSYGSAWPLWMEYLTRLDSPKLTAQLREATDRFLATHVPDNASGEVRRVAERFAIVAFAGELASTCRHQLTGWQKGEATKGVATCFQAWLQRRGGSGSADTDALMSRIRAFFEAHGESRLERFRAADGLPVRERAGFRRFDEVGVTEYMVLPEAFRRELCAGHDARQAARELIAAGWIKPAVDGKPSQVVRVPGMGAVRLYIFDSRKVHDGSL